MWQYNQCVVPPLARISTPKPMNSVFRWASFRIGTGRFLTRVAVSLVFMLVFL